ncbi:glycoside hydrolase family 97 protein [Filimonas effusa]|uniref:Glycoside hydrolase family 97 protein n=1 Tax=Filimonas effusa TaxID=2508721 RepID=A0A4Q1DB90_9BACT|nr:glycoside hydrolase family 97 protein [Filimonas effusa]RXK86560.1 glycoside hydrolase family 97 protein [Filimonas effusa]
MVQLKRSIVCFAMMVGAAMYTCLQAQVITSPGKTLTVKLSSAADGTVTYTVLAKKDTILLPSALGLVTSGTDLYKELVFTGASKTKPVNENYRLLYGKKQQVHYNANQCVFHYRNKQGKPIDIVFNVSDDAVAFQYLLPGENAANTVVTEEKTDFRFKQGVRSWLQPMQVAKTGWERSNPAYEEYYEQEVPVEKVADNTVGWVYPALFKNGNNWVAITEAGMKGNYCGTKLLTAGNGKFTTGFPDKREVVLGGGLLPVIDNNFTTPWKVIAVGSLKNIMESTAGTDLAAAQSLNDVSYIKPGKASWSWINSKDDYIIFKEQKKYIDFAAGMNWQYCLIDADWDRKIGYDSIQILADYAKSKNVGLLLWYNSAGDWNTVKYTPRNLLLTHESRMKEFHRIQAMGIKGVKIDFFGGDGQSVMQYYIDILNDAAACQLMVNFHGATLPRGWARTYPNLMTTEAVRGFENVTFNQHEADKQAVMCATVPFARNLFDPMDYTPMNLYKLSGNLVRRTSGGFELALSVLFLSGIQHFAESPEGMQHIPENVRSFLRNLPVSWEQVKFMEGYPGQYVALARKAGNKWYVAGINAAATPRKLTLNTAALGSKFSLLKDGDKPASFDETKGSTSAAQVLEIAPGSGFVMVIE